jgi:hypothetical protein
MTPVSRFARITFVASLAATGVATGCRGRSAAEADTHGRPAAAVAPVATGPLTLAAGTPAGGLRAWTAEVRRGLETLPALAVRDAAAAQKSALELYLTRQEYIEMYWGAAGKLTRGSALGPAVAEAERRFHLILAQIQPGKPADPAALRALIASLGEQYDRVVATAEQAGAPLDPHPLAAAGGVSARRQQGAPAPGGVM